jgi:hypothetical protein
MPDERDLLAQAQATQAVAAQEAERLQNAIAGVYGDLSDLRDRMDRADVGIELVAKFTKTFVGKDGIKVEGNIIGTDGSLGGAAGQNQNAAPLNQLPVNFINNGILRIGTFYLVEDPEDFED